MGASIAQSTSIKGFGGYRRRSRFLICKRSAVILRR
jgi:hypothetical protein